MVYLAGNLDLYFNPNNDDLWTSIQIVSTSSFVIHVMDLRTPVHFVHHFPHIFFFLVFSPSARVPSRWRVREDFLIEKVSWFTRGLNQMTYDSLASMSHPDN